MVQEEKGCQAAETLDIQRAPADEFLRLGVAANKIGHLISLADLLQIDVTPAWPTNLPGVRDCHQHVESILIR
jgi:hypothetical protein